MTTQSYLPPPPTPPETRSGRRGGGIALAIIGGFLALVALGLLGGGGVLMWADRTQRDVAGYLTSPTTRLSAASYAVAATNLDVAIDTPGWHLSQDALGSARITATSESSGGVFVGIASKSDVLRYLSGVGYNELTGYAGLSKGATYRAHGGGAPGLPGAEAFWKADVSGTGTQTLTWKVTSGQWAIVLMNADASRGVASDVSIGATAPFLFGLALGLLIGGGVAMIVAVLLLVGGIRMTRSGAGQPPQMYSLLPPPLSAQPPQATGSGALTYPLRFEGHLQEPLSRWLWLVKWLLLIPHFIVLALLFVAAFVLTVVAFFAILFTGRYPRSIFDFNVGVLRWWWRVGFYGYSALGTDHYPPFSFTADYPATLEVPYPERLSPGLVLVKWWLLAIPHYLIVAVLVGGTTLAVHQAYTYQVPYAGLITLLVLFAAVAVMFTSRYPRGIFDLVIGLNRWVFRVLVYVLLLRDEYPPFRLDMGEQEGGALPAPPAPAPPMMQPRPYGI